MPESQRGHKTHPFPGFGWLGITLVAVFWYYNWYGEGLRTHWGFFPLWLGFILVFDALNYLRKGHSLWTRSRIYFIVLFIISIPAWWLFELIDERAGLWHYTARGQFTDLEFALYASLSFSTVIPAVFEATEWMAGFKWMQKFRYGFKLGRSSILYIGFFITGWLLLILMLIRPDLSAPLIWISLFFILDPVNKWLGQPSIIEQAGRGDWRSVVALWSGVLICGFFWELWNYYAYPKWYYTVPFAEFWYVFEMPLLGYLGYLPFSLELFALYHFVTGIVHIDKENRYFLLSKWE